jgi:multiple sugar transport system substrate-binding protein
MNHAHLPAGLDGKTRELHLGFPILVFNFSKYPQTSKAFTAFMLEPAQFNPWIEAAQGYLSHFLKGYDANPIWTADPNGTAWSSDRRSRSDWRRNLSGNATDNPARPRSMD